MNFKLIKISLVIILTLLLFTIGGYVIYLNTLETIPKIDINQVKSMEIQFLYDNDGVNKKLLIERDRNEINEFVKAYNKAHYYRNDVDTTHPVNIFVYLKNGEKIWITGGSQGFQTVNKEGKQFNIQGWTLEYYFWFISKK